MIPTWQTTSREVAQRCAEVGLDLVQPFQVGWYNEAVESSYWLPDFGRPSSLGLLVGNTRALWAHFLEALRAEPTRLEAPHPLDAFVAEKTLAAVEPLLRRWPSSYLRWANDPPPRLVAMQRLAHVSGLAYLAPSHLNVHPVFGPWIALRAVVVVDVEGPPGPKPEPVDPCRACTNNCLARFEAAVAAAGSPRRHVDVAERWESWLAVRDACPVGRVYRYGDDQIRYHYLKDRRFLASLVERTP